MNSRALALIFAWVSVTGLAFFWGLPASSQTAKGAMWLALNVAAGPISRAGRELQDHASLSWLLIACLTLICASLSWHLWHRSTWSWIVLTSLWFTSGFVFSVGLFI